MDGLEIILGKITRVRSHLGKIEVALQLAKANLANLQGGYTSRILYREELQKARALLAELQAMELPE